MVLLVESFQKMSYKRGVDIDPFGEQIEYGKSVCICESRRRSAFMRSNIPLVPRSCLGDGGRPSLTATRSPNFEFRDVWFLIGCRIFVWSFIL